MTWYTGREVSNGQEKGGGKYGLEVVDCFHNSAHRRVGVLAIKIHMLSLFVTIFAEVNVNCRGNVVLRQTRFHAVHRTTVKRNNRPSGFCGFNQPGDMATYPGDARHFGDPLSVQLDCQVVTELGDIGAATTGIDQWLFDIGQIRCWHSHMNR